MKGIVIAAGMGNRMGAFTEVLPKCLLPIAGRPLLDRTVENLRAAGCSEIVVVVGHRAEAIELPGIQKVNNPDYRTNNILHSLAFARAHLEGPLMVTYSDIWVEPWIHRQLAEAPGDLVLAVDRAWRSYYEGRTHHPVSEAENVTYDGDAQAVRIGKHVGDAAASSLECGEFLGLWRMSAAGTRRFLDVFREIDARISPEAPFQAAKAWKRAYVTDLIQELVDRGDPVSCSLVERGWAELDTQQDYERLPRIAASQRLFTIARHAAAARGVE